MADRKSSSLRWVCALVLAQGCRAPAHGTVESFVRDVPTTLDAVKALARPPAVTVDVAKESIVRGENGSANCGHAGAACLAILLLPWEWEGAKDDPTVATVTRGGAVEYQGVFSSDGEFRHARVVDGSSVRFIARKTIARLRRKMIVEVGRAPSATSAMVPTRILPQAPALADAFLAALVDEGRSHFAGKPDGLTDSTKGTIGQMYEVLGKEDADQLARAFLKSDRIAPGVKLLLSERL